MENKNLIIGLIVLGLVIIAVFQSFQLADLRNKVSSEKINVAPKLANNDVSQKMQNMPSMVGGC